MINSIDFTYENKRVTAEADWRSGLYVEINGHPVADITGDCSPRDHDCKKALRLSGAALESFWLARLKERAVEAYEDWEAFQVEESSCA